VLAIWIHAHGISVLCQAGRIGGDGAAFREIARNSMRRLILGLAA
jgi:hypothetical protein